MARIVVDPVTRIEGHLRVEAVVENGVITDAFSSGTMVRGLEKILIGRDPRDAWAITERVCGVCTTVHALASVRAVEDALGISVPPTAELIRNIMTDHAVCAGSRDPLLSPARARLGGHRQRAQGRSEESRGTGQFVLEVGQEHAGVFHCGAGQDQGIRGQRAGHLCQRLLGPPGLQAAA